MAVATSRSGKVISLGSNTVKPAPLTYQLRLRNDDASKGVQVHVDPATLKGAVVHVVDFVSDAAYRVVEWTQQDPMWQGFTLQQNPADAAVFPNGNKLLLGKVTSQQTSSGLVFAYAWNPSTSPSGGKNQDVVPVNAFYITNKVPDTFYKNGFTENALNLQDDNYGKGRKKGVRVEMQVQASGTSNANFATPLDCLQRAWTGPMHPAV
ncbi:hypothetical protein FRB90_002017 [Tulasnella sp. 427]|nr:hypothetical protein FRB90_002017 [Tulasnella sp. 427]